jgi:hypothetical protein
MKDIGLSNPKPIAGVVSAAGSAWSAPLEACSWQKCKWSSHLSGEGGLAHTTQMALMARPFAF